MVKLHEVLQNYQARLLLQVHDELVFEVPQMSGRSYSQIPSMELAVQLCSLVVDAVQDRIGWKQRKNI